MLGHFLKSCLELFEYINSSSYPANIAKPYIYFPYQYIFQIYKILPSAFQNIDKAKKSYQNNFN